MESDATHPPGEAEPQGFARDDTLLVTPRERAPGAISRLSLADTRAATGAPRAVVENELARGASVGRFTVLRTLGAGGMGVVYAAYDPELDRNVALKLIRGTSDAAARTRLHREAQALAKLSHPNVVAVHDVGTHGGQVWLAMEFVVGRTLERWRAEESPSWRQVVEVIRQVARGVAAAHKAGLLHRDLKPENIMVGADGRVRVMDFGLARARAEHTPAPSPDRPDRTHALSIELTMAGALMGTPAYMAAEQFAGTPADARTDQFALCATMWEALYGERAFAGESLVDLAAAVSAGERRRAPVGAKVPTWLRRVVERGLERDPEQRYASMDEFLLALDADPRPRRWALGLGAGLVVTAATTALALGVQRERARAACRDAGAELASVWSDEERAAVQKALAESDGEYAKAASERVTPWLDTYTEEWSQTRTQLCLATARRQPSSGLTASDRAPDEAALAEQALACLQEGRDQFEFLIEQLSDAPGGMVIEAVRAASMLPRPSSCADEAMLKHRPPPPAGAAAREEVRRLRALLIKAATLRSIGDYKRGLALAEEAQRGADALEWEPLKAEAALTRSELHDKLGEYDAAAETAAEAFLIASAARAEILYADAAGQRAWILGVRQSRPEDGELWGRLQGVLLDRAGVPEGDIRRAHHLNTLGAIYFYKESFDAARERYEQTLAIRERALGEEHPDVAASLNNLGNVYAVMKNYEEARRYHQRTLALRVKILGEEHPEVATSLNNLGRLYGLQGSYDEAQEHVERALKIRERALGEDHPKLTSTLNNLGALHERRGSLAQSRAAYERALKILIATFGEHHPSVVSQLFTLGDVLYEQGAVEDAKETLERALQTSELVRGEEHPEFVKTLLRLGDLHRAEADYGSARARYEQARAISTRSAGDAGGFVPESLNKLGHTALAQGQLEAARVYYERAQSTLEERDQASSSDMAIALTGQGVVHTEREEFEAARRVLERALTIHGRAGGRGADLAATRFAHARALWAEHTDRERAHHLAKQARDGFREAGRHHARARADVEAWLRRHKRTPTDEETTR